LRGVSSEKFPQSAAKRERKRWTFRPGFFPEGSIVPQFPKPLYRHSRGIWYVLLSGKQVSLGSEKQFAFDKYHKLMQGRLLGCSDGLLFAIFASFSITFPIQRVCCSPLNRKRTRQLPFRRRQT
jgi:hypothetical protein